METPVKKVDAKHDKCRLAELVQYHCEPTLDDDGRPTFKCQPIIRVFRLCPRRPAVELTRFVDIDPSTGAVDVPPASSENFPKGKPWRDVIRHDPQVSETERS